MGTWRYASDKSMDADQSPCLNMSRIVASVSIRKCTGWINWFMSLSDTG